MQKNGTTPTVGTIMEKKEKEQEGDRNLEPQLQVEASHGRNIECTCHFNVSDRQIKFSFKNGNKTNSVPKNPEILN